MGQHLLHDDAGELGDHQCCKGPHCDTSGRSQPVATNTPARPPAETTAVQRDDEEQPLNDDAQGRRTSQHPDHLRRPGGRIRVSTKLHQEPHQTSDLHHIRQHRAPHERGELVTRVEDLPEDRVKAVEEDLRHTDEAEEDRQVTSRPAGGEVEIQQPRRGHSCQHRDDEDRRE